MCSQKLSASDLLVPAAPTFLSATVLDFVAPLTSLSALRASCFLLSVFDLLLPDFQLVLLDFQLLFFAFLLPLKLSPFGF